MKAAFTRTYNKETHLTPYAFGAAKKGRGRGGGGGGEEMLELEGEGETSVMAEEEEEDEDDFSKNTMIKVLLSSDFSACFKLQIGGTSVS